MVSDERIKNGVRSAEGKQQSEFLRGRDGWRDRYAVICRYDEGGCGAESGLYHYMSEAIEAWNRRASDDTD